MSLTRREPPSSHNARASFIGLAESHGIGVTGTAIAAKGFICHVCHVRAPITLAHYRRGLRQPCDKLWRSF